MDNLGLDTVEKGVLVTSNKICERVFILSKNTRSVRQNLIANLVESPVKRRLLLLDLLWHFLERLVLEFHLVELNVFVDLNVFDVCAAHLALKLFVQFCQQLFLMLLVEFLEVINNLIPGLLSVLDQLVVLLEGEIWDKLKLNLVSGVSLVVLGQVDGR